MANLPADLPTNWTQGQIISPNGTEVGLSQQHGYNYLNEQVNDTQAAVNSIQTITNQIQWVMGVDETGVYVVQIAETATSDTVSTQFALDEPGASPYSVEIEGTGEKSISNAENYQFEIL